MLRGEAAATLAAQTAAETFAGSGRSDNLPKVQLEVSESLAIVDLIVRSELAPSKGEARRLIKGNGIRLNDEPVTDETAVLTAADFIDGSAKLSAGKKRHILIIAA
jgi:tyrosyl-tRNA synthetase